MNVYLEIALAIARAIVIALSSWAVRRGWVTADQAHAVTGAATLWLAAGLGAAGLALWHSIRGAIRTAATIQLAKNADPATPAAYIRSWRKSLTISSLWYLAKNLHRQLQAEATTPAKDA